jgi:toxin ParE1/3/4
LLVPEIIWSPQAVEEVESIRDYISRDSPHFGVLTAQRIVGTVERLTRFPESGRIVPEFGDARLREVLWRNYRIVYRLSPMAVEIVTVFHGARIFTDGS